VSVPSRSSGATLLWLSLIFLFAAAITATIFLVFIPEPDRGMTFYVVLSLVIAAELVLFSHLAYNRLAETDPTVSTAARIQVQGLVVIWFIATVIIAAYATSQPRADTLASDKLLLIDLVITFLFFLAAAAIYGRSREVEEADQSITAKRVELRTRARDIDQVLLAVDQLGAREQQHAALAAGVRKKLELTRTSLESTFVSSRVADAQGSDGEFVMRLDEEVEKLLSLSASAATVPVPMAAELLNKIGGQAEALTRLIRQHDRSQYV